MNLRFVAVAVVLAGCGSRSGTSSSSVTARPVPVSSTCTADSFPGYSRGSCAVREASGPAYCVDFTGTGPIEPERTRCDASKGTWSERPCPRANVVARCLSQCGAPRESVDTYYAATAEEWAVGCRAARGTWLAVPELPFASSPLGDNEIQPLMSDFLIPRTEAVLEDIRHQEGMSELKCKKADETTVGSCAQTYTRSSNPDVCRARALMMFLVLYAEARKKERGDIPFGYWLACKAGRVTTEVNIFYNVVGDGILSMETQGPDKSFEKSVIWEP